MKFCFLYDGFEGISEQVPSHFRECSFVQQLTYLQEHSGKKEIIEILEAFQRSVHDCVVCLKNEKNLLEGYAGFEVVAREQNVDAVIVLSGCLIEKVLSSSYKGPVIAYVSREMVLPDELELRHFAMFATSYEVTECLRQNGIMVRTIPLSSDLKTVSYDRLVEKITGTVARNLVFSEIETNEILVRGNDFGMVLMDTISAQVIENRESDAYIDVVQLDDIKILKLVYVGQEDVVVSALRNILQDTIQSGDSVIELGCNEGLHGELISYLFDIDLRYIGMDVASRGIELGKVYSPEFTFEPLYCLDTVPVGSTADVLIVNSIISRLTDAEAYVEKLALFGSSDVILTGIALSYERPQFGVIRKEFGVELFEVRYNREELRQLCQHFGLVLTKEEIVYADEENDRYEAIWCLKNTKVRNNIFAKTTTQINWSKKANCFTARERRFGDSLLSDETAVRSLFEWLLVKQKVHKEIYIYFDPSVSSEIERFFEGVPGLNKIKNPLEIIFVHLVVTGNDFVDFPLEIIFEDLVVIGNSKLVDRSIFTVDASCVILYHRIGGSCRVGEDLLDVGDPEQKALAVFSVIEECGLISSALYWNLSRIAQKAGNVAEQESLLKKAFRFDPNDARVLISLVEFYCNNENLDSAMLPLRHLVAIEPNNGKAWKMLIELLVEQKRFSEVQEIYKNIDKTILSGF